MLSCLISVKGCSCSAVWVPHTPVVGDPRQAGRGPGWPWLWPRCLVTPGGSGLFWLRVGMLVALPRRRAPWGQGKVKVVYSTAEDLIEAGAWGQPRAD